MSDIQTKTKLEETDTGSPDDKAHYVNKQELAKAAVQGGKVRALCGVYFEPVRDPERFPICEACKTIKGRYDVGRSGMN